MTEKRLNISDFSNKDLIEICEDKGRLREVIVRQTQKELSNPNLSEIYKDVSIQVAEEELKKLGGIK